MNIYIGKSEEHINVKTNLTWKPYGKWQFFNIISTVQSYWYQVGNKYKWKSNQNHTFTNSNVVGKYFFHNLNQFQIRVSHVCGHRIRRFCLAQSQHSSISIWIRPVQCIECRSKDSNLTTRQHHIIITRQYRTLFLVPISPGSRGPSKTWS